MSNTNVPGYKQTKWGFYQLNPMPTQEELVEYYSIQYQSVPHNLTQNRSCEEIYWLENTLWTDIEERLFSPSGDSTLLDYGSGTGDFARFMTEKRWNVTEYDLARDFAPTFLKQEFDAVAMINVLEHVRDPQSVLKDIIYSVLAWSGILAIVVPNDFSPLQMELKDRHGEYWLRYPDHINYFSRDSLINLLRDTGFDIKYHTADFPMEIFLLFGFNYLENSYTGSACHNKRKMFELSISTDTRRQLYKSLSDVGIGRNLIIFAQKI